MSSIDSLDLDTYVVTAVEDVFDTMLSMDLCRIPPDRALFSGDRLIVGTVRIAGSILGNVNLHLNRRFARKITAAMLGVPVAGVNGDEEVHDVIGELCNMVGGDLKSRLCDAGRSCELSIPTITAGSDLCIESKGWRRHERYGFQNREDSALLEVFMKNGE